jgi:hypothetical protein
LDAQGAAAVGQAYRQDAGDVEVVAAPAQAETGRRPATKEAAIIAYNSSYEVNT